MDRPPLPSASSHGENPANPFSDRARHPQFAEQPAPYHTPYESTTSLPQDFHQDQYEDDEFLEKQPLAAGESFTGGFYPPGCVSYPAAVTFCPFRFAQSNRSERIWRPLWPPGVGRIHLNQRH